MKVAYGTFSPVLLVEYCHDQVADETASDFNVTWSRTSPIIVSAGDDAYQTYVTLECDEGMGMTVVGAPNNIVAFNYASSSVIPSIEYGIMEYLGFNYQSNSTFTGDIGSVMVDMGNLFLNGTAFDIFEQNGFTIIKAVGNDSLLMVYDPVTGIVRDINLVNGYSGAYCYSNYQTNLADDLGTYLSKFNVNETLLGIGSSAAISLGVALLVCSGPPGWLGLAVIGLGMAGSYYAAGLNEGWTTSKWTNFGLNVGPALIPGIGAEGGVAGKLTIGYVTSNGIEKTVTTVPRNYEGYVITNMPNWAGGTFAGGYMSTVQYVKYGTTQSVLRTAYGATDKEAVKNALIGLGTDRTQAVINGYSPEINQYSSTSYNNLSDYLQQI